MLSDRVDAQHGLRMALESGDDAEVFAALESIDMFCKYSTQFAIRMHRIITDKVSCMSDM